MKRLSVKDRDSFGTLSKVNRHRACGSVWYDDWIPAGTELFKEVDSRGHIVKIHMASTTIHASAVHRYVRLFSDGAIDPAREELGYLTDSGLSIPLTVH